MFNQLRTTISSIAHKAYDFYTTDEKFIDTYETSVEDGTTYFDCQYCDSKKWSLTSHAMHFKHAHTEDYERLTPEYIEA